MGEQLEVLNTDAHRAVRMSAFAGDHPSIVTIVMQEFAAAAAVCPIFLAKNADTGAFFVGALFGFKAGELLVEGAGTTDGAFRPLDLQRQGFYIAEENIAIDLAHPRFGSDATIALFDDEGAPSEAMRGVQWVLGQLEGGLGATERFIAVLLGYRLIEPIDISLRFDDGEKIDLEGLYTVSRDRLNELEDEKIVELFRNGYIEAAHRIILSLNQIGVLARRRNLQLAGAL